MLKRWILATVAAAALVFAPVGVGAKGGGHSSGSHSSKGSKGDSSEKKAKTVHVKEHTKKDGTTVAAHDRSAPNRCSSCPRDKHGRILRDPKQRASFEKASGYPHGRKGYIVDHIIPLECGGADVPSNMQWQTKEAAAFKDKGEVRCRK